MMCYTNPRLLAAMVVSLVCCMGAVESSSSTSSPLNLHVQVNIQKVGAYSNCSMAVVSDLESEMREWIDDELHVVLGDNGFDIPQAVALERHDHLQMSMLLRCKDGCSNHDSINQSKTVIARTLLWSSPEVVRQWFVDASQLLKGCMGEKIKASVTVKELDFDPDSLIRQQVVVGYENVSSDRVNVTGAVGSASF